jgi:hypothetical protein
MAFILSAILSVAIEGHVDKNPVREITNNQAPKSKQDPMTKNQNPNQLPRGMSLRIGI